jgi:hypothetical protein
VRDYEDLKNYIDQILNGNRDVLWPGVPKYLAKTSGTTSGVKYIPISNESMPLHIKAATSATLNYIANSGDADLFDGKLIFLSGSPVLDQKSGINVGRLSGIVNHEVPSWLQNNQLPSYETNCIENWEDKLDAVVNETLKQDMRVISGIPPWVQMYYERLLQVSGKASIKEIFPNYKLFIYGGVNFEPYRAQLEKLVGGRVPSLETYPASEGFIAFQDSLENDGLLLNTNAGILYEFIALSTYDNDDRQRLGLADVEIGVDYALILSTNAGLWAYDIGDCVRFVSLNPFKLVVSGRVKHFISAFGEHVIAKEVEESMLKITRQFGLSIVEFTVAPNVTPENGEIPYHEWFVEFEEEPSNIEEMPKLIDEEMCQQNIYYEDLRKGNILQELKLRSLKRGAFIEYMKSKGKLGGQNKVPRLSNDRKIANQLNEYII